MKITVLQNNYGLWTWAGVDDDGNQRGRPSIVGGFSRREDAIRDIFVVFPDVDPALIFADGMSLGSRVSAMRVPVDQRSSGAVGDPADIAAHHPEPQQTGIGAGTGDAPRNISHTVRHPAEPQEMPRIVTGGPGRALAPDAIDAPEVAL